MVQTWWFNFYCTVLMNRRFIQTSRPHLIKSLLWELSREGICFEAFRLSTVKKLADGKLLVQQMPQAEEQNSRGGRGPKGKVGIWLTADFVLISLNFPHVGTRSLFSGQLEQRTNPGYAIFMNIQFIISTNYLFVHFRAQLPDKIIL